MKNFRLVRFTNAFLLLLLFSAACKKEEKNDNNNGGASTPTQICNFSGGELRLSNIREGLDYIITCDLDISSGTLIIESGTQVHVQAGKSIFITGTGSIQILGNSSEPVIIRPASGSWGGILVASNNPLNKLQHARLESGGTESLYFSAPGNAMVAITGRCQLNEVALLNSFSDGVLIDADANVTQWSGVKIEQSASFPINCYVGQARTFTPGSTQLVNNAIPRIRLFGNAFSGDHTWFNLGLPYLVFNGIDFTNGNWTLNAGVVIEVAADKAIYVTSNGTLSILGSATEKVIIRGSNAFPGWWRGIELVSNSPLNNWTHTEVMHFGSGSLNISGLKAGLFMGGYSGFSTRLAGNFISFKNGEGCAIIKSGSEINLTATNVTFENVTNEICDY